MKIGFYLSKVRFGGGEKVQLFLMKEFHERGHNIVLFTPDPSVLKITLPYEVVLLKRKKFWSLSFFLQITSYQLKNHIDYMIMFYCFIYVFAASWLTRTPLLSSVRVEYGYNQTSFFRTLLQWLWLEKSRGVIFQTPKVQSCASSGVQKKSIVIPNALMLDDIEKLSKIPSTKKITALGRLSVEKGCIPLIKAFAKTVSFHDYNLFFYGEGDLKIEMEALIKKMNLSNRIFLAGYSTDLSESLGDTEIFILNSKTEGMPNALIEAMSIGKACISSRFSSGAAELLIEDGVNGLLIDYNNQEQLETAIIKLTNDDDYRNKLAKKASRTAIKLNKNNIIPQWISYMNKLKN